MRLSVSLPLLFAAAITVGASLATFATAGESRTHLAQTVEQIEDRLNARVGIALIDTGSGETWSRRADERFLMTSTAKVPICATILARQEEGALSLSETLPIRPADLLSYAPVTSTHVGQRMSVSELCLAAIDMSDNSAANLVLDRAGGPEAVTGLFRRAGDLVSRLDRREPDLNTFAPGDPRDTTTPAAMAATLRELLLGETLSPASREQLAGWMRHGAVTQDLLRDHAPAGWDILDKSGSSDRTRNIVALISPPDEAPWIAAIFLADADADFATRNTALKDLSAAVMAVIRD